MAESYQVYNRIDQRVYTYYKSHWAKESNLGVIFALNSLLSHLPP
jgi:hypothetical protein